MTKNYGKCHKTGQLGTCPVEFTIDKCLYPDDCPYMKPDKWAELATVRPDKYTSTGPNVVKKLQMCKSCSMYSAITRALTQPCKSIRSLLSYTNASGRQTMMVSCGVQARSPLYKCPKCNELHTSGYDCVARIMREPDEYKSRRNPEQVRKECVSV